MWVLYYHTVFIHQRPALELQWGNFLKHRKKNSSELLENIDLFNGLNCFPLYPPPIANYCIVPEALQLQLLVLTRWTEAQTVDWGVTGEERAGGA